MRIGAAAGVALLLLGACTAGEPATAPTPIPPPEAIEPDDGATDAPLAELPPPQDGTPPPDAAPNVGEDCDTAQRTAIDAAVDGQLAAFAEGDYAAALDFATQGFRAARTPEDFEALITEGFPIAADAASHVTDTCRTDGTQAAIQVTVVSSTGEIGGFTYLVEREPDGIWRIAGAVPADARGGVA